MAVIKTIKRNHRSESLRGRFMVDTVRGVLRIRKWPRKRGTPKSKSQLWWIDWFKQANKLAKYVDAASMRRAIELTAGTGKYPRDILLQAMRGRLYVWQDENGKTWYPMAGIQDISDSLDVLAQEVGSVLVRAADRWRNVAGGAAGEVFTHQGPSTSPTWEPPLVPGASLGCLCINSAVQPILTGTITALTWDGESYDDGGYHDNIVNPSRITVPAGATRARFTGHLNWQASSGGNYRQSWVSKNGAHTPYPGRPHTTFPDLNGAAQVQQPVTGAIFPVTPGDYYELFCVHDAGATLNIQINNSEFGVVFNS
jgi:hypothetical protein